jgi:hypothetical protein
MNKDKVKEIKSEGHGTWLGQIYVDGKKFWSHDDEYNEWRQDGFDIVLQSDSSKRDDLIGIINNDFENAQKFKEELENLQRKDKKLREKKI